MTHPIPPPATPLSADSPFFGTLTDEQVATIKARLGCSSAQSLAETVSRLIATIEHRDATIARLRATISREY